jgi:hypothetical protein
LEVHSAADPNVDFSLFKTFNFAPPSTNAGPLLLTEQNRSRIQSAVIQEMADRPCQLSDHPDLLFAIDLEKATKSYDKSNPEVDSGSVGANLSRHYGITYNETLGSQSVVDYTEGTLSVRARDTKQNRVVWEGHAIGVLYQNRPDNQVQQRIHEAVKAIFAQFPLKPQSPRTERSRPRPPVAAAKVQELPFYPDRKSLRASFFGVRSQRRHPDLGIIGRPGGVSRQRRVWTSDAL